MFMKMIFSGPLGFFLVLVATVFTLVTTIILQWLWREWRKINYMTKIMAAQGIHGPPPSFIAGNAREYSRLKHEAEAEDMKVLSHDILARILPGDYKTSQVYGKNSLTWMAWEPSVNISEPQLVHDVLTSRNFVKSGIQKTILMPLFGQGIVMATGDEWSNQRNMLNPVFHMESTKAMLKTMEQCASCMIHTWGQSVMNSQEKCVELDAHSMLVRLTAEIFARTAFGDTFEYTERYIQLENELQEQVILQPFFCLIPGYRLLPTKINRNLWKVNKEIRKCVTGIINKRVIESDGDPALFGKDILGLLLEAMHNSENKKVSRGLVVDQCKSFFFAGHETTAHTITWAMMLLALNPEWQDKARKEIREVKAFSHHFDAETLSKLKTVGMIISETLRLYPPAPQVRRGACVDTYIGGKDGMERLFVPKGLYVSISILELHHDKALWGPDASEFHPERFSKGNIPVGAYLPFGVGSRVCIGRNFALMEAKLVLSMLLSNFEWKMSPAYRHAPISRVTLYPQHGMQLLVSHANSPTLKERGSVKQTRLI